MSELTRYEEATAFVASFDDSPLRTMLEFALTTVLTRRDMDPGIRAAEPLDLRFFLEAVRAIFANQAVIQAIVSGRSDRLRG